MTLIVVRVCCSLVASLSPYTITWFDVEAFIIAVPTGTSAGSCPGHIGVCSAIEQNKFVEARSIDLEDLSMILSFGCPKAVALTCSLSSKLDMVAVSLLEC